MKIERDMVGIGYPEAAHFEIAKVLFREANKKLFFLYPKPPSELEGFGYKKKSLALRARLLLLSVGAKGFEPLTPWV